MKVNEAQSSTIVHLALNSFSDSINTKFIYSKTGMYSIVSALLQFKKGILNRSFVYRPLWSHFGGLLPVAALSRGELAGL